MRPQNFAHHLYHEGASTTEAIIAATALMLQPLAAQQYYCHYPNVSPWYGAAYEGNHAVIYNAYINFDHVNAPGPCAESGGYSSNKIYKGDPGAVYAPDYPL